MVTLKECKREPDNGHKEITDWAEFKKRHEIVAPQEIEGVLIVYRQALRTYFTTNDEGALSIVNRGLLTTAWKRRYADMVLRGVRKNMNGQKKAA